MPCEKKQATGLKRLCIFLMAGNYFVHGGAVALPGQTKQ